MRTRTPVTWGGWILLSSTLCISLVASLPARGENPLQQAETKLKPLKAITTDEVPYRPIMSPLQRVVPAQGSDTIVVVFFQGFQKEGVSVEDMNWRLVPGQGRTAVASFGFGVPVPQQPVRMIGTLTKGSIFPQAEGADPLLALLFVLPRGAKQITLQDPNGNHRQLAIDVSWSPGKEHLLSNVESNGRIDMPIEGEGWKVK